MSLSVLNWKWGRVEEMGISETIQHMFNHMSAAVLGRTPDSKNTDVSRTDASPGLVELTPQREMHVTS